MKLKGILHNLTINGKKFEVQTDQFFKENLSMLRKEWRKFCHVCFVIKLKIQYVYYKVRYGLTGRS